MLRVVERKLSSSGLDAHPTPRCFLFQNPVLAERTEPQTPCEAGGVWLLDPTLCLPPF